MSTACVTSAGASTARAAPPLAGAAAASPSSFVALMYHNIVRDQRCYAELSPSATSYFVTLDAFREQIEQLHACGARAFQLEELRTFYESAASSSVKGCSESAAPGVFFTFDDGWDEAVDIAEPSLDGCGADGIVFVTTDFLDRPHFLSRARLRHWSCRRLHVGSHARSHRMLRLLGEDEIREELVSSKKLLEDLTGSEVDTLSIPSGAVDRRVRRIAAEAGYRMVFDSRVRVNRRGESPLSIGRVALMHDTSIAAFRRYLRQQILPERVRRTLLEAPKRLLGLRRYERLRRRLLGERAGQSVTHAS